MRARWFVSAGLVLACGRYDLGGFGDSAESGDLGSNGARSGGSSGAGARASETGGAPVSVGGTSHGGAPTTSSGGTVTRNAGGRQAGGSSDMPSQGGSAPNTGGSAPSAGESSGGAGDTAAGGAAGAPAAGGAQVDGGAGGSGGAAGEAGAGRGGEGGEAGGAPRRSRSCAVMDPLCGSDRDSCCSVLTIPAGEFRFGGVVEAPTDSHVSAFLLDRYEVTVSRFQSFLDDYDAFRARGELGAGAGVHPKITGSGWDPSWERGAEDPADLRLLEPERDALEAAVSDCMGIPLPTSMSGQPINCVTWYEAEAFCIWDGGRLPTELEWEYAAAGGSENRIYPWGDAEPTRGRAMYDCSSVLPDSPCMIPPVGSYPQGASRFGPLDLAGSVWEWTFDVFSTLPRALPCNDCAEVVELADGNPRSTRGGGWESAPFALSVSLRSGLPAGLRLPSQGFRCAYDLR